MRWCDCEDVGHESSGGFAALCAMTDIVFLRRPVSLWKGNRILHSLTQATARNGLMSPGSSIRHDDGRKSRRFESVRRKCYISPQHDHDGRLASRPAVDKVSLFVKRQLHEMSS